MICHLNLILRAVHKGYKGKKDNLSIKSDSQNDNTKEYISDSICRTSLDLLIKI